MIVTNKLGHAIHNQFVNRIINYAAAFDEATDRENTVIAFIQLFPIANNVVGVI